MARRNRRKLGRRRNPACPFALPLPLHSCALPPSPPHLHTQASGRALYDGAALPEKRQRHARARCSTHLPRGTNACWRLARALREKPGMAT